MSTLSPGAVLADRFEVLGALGRGGTATVVLAHDRQLDERVALKVVHAHLAGSAAVRARLRREVVAAGRLRHRGAVVAQELVEAEGLLAVRMPYHPGVTLSEAVERDGPMTGAALRRIADQLADALAAAHRVGVVHRDVTPNNVLVDASGDAVLTDFGLARLAGQKTATGTGAIGTPGYAAPEVIRGGRGDPRADLYGLGATLVFAATGASPFPGRDAMASLARQLADDRVRLADARGDLPPALGAAIDALLAPDPQDRPDGAEAFRDALRAAPTRAASGPRPGPPGERRTDPGERRTDPGERGRAGRPAPAPSPDRPPSLPSPTLWRGPFAVIVRERAQDRHRRHELRRGRNRPRSRFEQDVAEGVELLRREVLEGWLGLSPKRSPEEQLATAVARAAALPPEALEVPEAMYARRFRLVSGVDEAVAARLRDEAERAGFRAEVGPAEARALEAQPSGDLALRLLMGVALATAFAVVFLPELLAIAGVQVSIPALIAMFVVPAMILRKSRRRPRTEVLPVAYEADLRPWLVPALAARVEAAAPVGRVAAPAAPVGRVDDRQQASAAPQASPVAAPPVEDPAAARAAARVEGLAEAVEARAEALPGPVVRELRELLRDLRARTAELRVRLAELDRALADADGDAAAAALDRVQARVDRLSTLARAGDDAAARERDGLLGALARHREALDRADALDGHRTELLARLLEIAASADRARADLVEDPDAAREAGRVAETLAARVRHARDAEAELDGLAPPPRPVPERVR